MTGRAHKPVRWGYDVTMDTRIDRLAETPGLMAQLVADATDELLDVAPEGEWNARTIMAHLRDDEYLYMGTALARALGEESPVVCFMGPDWEANRNRMRDRREWLLADFALHRQASVTILRNLRPQDWSRAMQTADGGRFTILQFVDGWLKHDNEHMTQIETLIGENIHEVLQRRAKMADWRTGRKA